jgi:hypothetical protein
VRSHVIWNATVSAGIQKAVASERYAVFTEFFKNFYNTDLREDRDREP